MKLYYVKIEVRTNIIEPDLFFYVFSLYFNPKSVVDCCKFVDNECDKIRENYKSKGREIASFWISNTIELKIGESFSI